MFSGVLKQISGMKWVKNLFFSRANISQYFKIDSIGKWIGLYTSLTDQMRPPLNVYEDNTWGRGV